MAVDQTEAMIAAIKAQLEKERAAEAAKQKRLEEEQALKNLSSNKKKSSDSGSKSQYKTLSAEELARIEEKKRRKREEALGIVHEDKPEETENNEAETNKPDTNKEAEGEAKEAKTEDQRGCDDSSVACLSDPEFCKCGSHRFWRGNQCGDRVLSRRKGTGQGKCSSVKGYSSFCCSWCDHDSSLYPDHAGISADVHIE